MSSGVLLASALGVLALAIVMVVIAAVPAKSGPGGIVRAVAAIERHYAKHAEAAGPDAADQLSAPPGWLKAIALRLSPSGAFRTSAVPRSRAVATDYSLLRLFG